MEVRYIVAQSQHCLGFSGAYSGQTQKEHADKRPIAGVPFAAFRVWHMPSASTGQGFSEADAPGIQLEPHSPLLSPSSAAAPMQKRRLSARGICSAAEPASVSDRLTDILGLCQPEAWSIRRTSWHMDVRWCRQQQAAVAGVFSQPACSPPLINIDGILHGTLVLFLSSPHLVLLATPFLRPASAGSFDNNSLSSSFFSSSFPAPSFPPLLLVSSCLSFLSVSSSAIRPYDAPQTSRSSHPYRSTRRGQRHAVRAAATSLSPAGPPELGRPLAAQCQDPDAARYVSLRLIDLCAVPRFRLRFRPRLPISRSVLLLSNFCRHQG